LGDQAAPQYGASNSYSAARFHVRPARSIFSNTLNFCHSAIAALVTLRDGIARSACQEGRRYRVGRRKVSLLLFQPISALMTFLLGGI
jgi:hypothetical protein